MLSIDFSAAGRKWMKFVSEISSVLCSGSETTGGRAACVSGYKGIREERVYED